MSEAIIPAILSTSLEGLTAQLASIEGAVPLVQLDVVDGAYAPAYAWPYTKKGSGLAEFISGAKGLPSWEAFDFEIDLMVNNSKRDALEWVAAGASRIIVHLDSPDASDALAALQQYREGAYPVSIGVGLPSVSTAQILPAPELFDYVQVMGIARPGFQGEAFDTRALETIAAIHAAAAQLPIQVDGGVKEDTIPALREKGVSGFVMGSAVFTNPHPALYIEQVRRKLR